LSPLLPGQEVDLEAALPYSSLINATAASRALAVNPHNSSMCSVKNELKLQQLGQSNSRLLQQPRLL
jgi:hypothetical protein